MSAFLGKIHYWLYNKVELHEMFIEEIINLAKSKGYDTDKLINESFARFGEPTRGTLESEIDHSNIHGWLQERITSVESRLAYVVTELLKENVVDIDELSQVFHKNAVDTMREVGFGQGTPQEYFKLIFDYMLEGMPCDRINEVVEDNGSVLRWKTTRDIHKQYWDAVEGNVNNFYTLRNEWIKGFLKTVDVGFEVEQIDGDTLYSIIV